MRTGCRNTPRTYDRRGCLKKEDKYASGLMLRRTPDRALKNRTVVTEMAVKGGGGNLWQLSWAGGEVNATTGNIYIFFFFHEIDYAFVKFYMLYRERKKPVINRFWGFQNNVSVPEQLKNIWFSFPFPFLVKFRSFSVFVFVPWTGSEPWSQRMRKVFFIWQSCQGWWKMLYSMRHFYVAH